MPPLPERRNSRVPTIPNASPRSIGRAVLRSARDPRSWLLSTLAWGAFDYIVDELLQEDDSIERQLRLQQLIAPRIQLWEQAARDFPHRDLLDDPTSPDYDGRAQTSSLIRAVARMMGSRLQDAAQAAGFEDSLRPLSRNRQALLGVAQTLALLALAWFALSAGLYFGLVGSPAPSLGARRDSRR